MTVHTVLITGASSGIGARAAQVLSAAGLRVFGAARRTDAVAALGGVTPVALDLSDEASIDAAAEFVLAHGHVDILINCAGLGEFGTVEETASKDAKAEMQVNVFGPMRLTQALLPSMRTAGRGRIVNVSSLAGEFSAPLGGWYHASEFALEALSDALRGEVEQFGVDVVVIIQPSFVATEWHDTAMTRLVEASGTGPYAHMVTAMRNHFSSDLVAKQMSSVDDVAKVIASAATDPRPKTRYRVGKGSSVAVAMSTLLPDRAFDYAIRKQFGYPKTGTAASKQPQPSK